MTPKIASTFAVLAGAALMIGGVGVAIGAGASAGAVGATGVAGPPATGPAVASLDAAVPIAAGGGWVVWSVPVAGGWGLEGSHRGVTRALGVALRPQPFDVTVGTDARGGAVLTFSRCRTTPTTDGFPLATVQPLTGSGCRVHVYNLSTKTETTPAIPHPSGTSDTTPAISHGRIAFARLDPAHHAQVQQVLLWSPGHSRLISLVHGTLPSKCPPGAGTCAGAKVSGVVQGLAYDGPVVSFLWQPMAPDVIGDAAWEIRADVVATGHSRLVGDGVAGEVCMGPGDDLSAPTPPVLSGYTVRYASLEASCYVFGSLISTISATGSGNGTYAGLPGPGVVLGLAQDGSKLYALEAPDPTTEVNPTCTPGAPCELDQVTPGPSQPETHQPFSPFG